MTLYINIQGLWLIVVVFQLLVYVESLKANPIGSSE